MKVGDKVSSEEADEIICAGGDCSELGWVVTKLPPEPVPTAEELLEEVLDLFTSGRAWFVYRGAELQNWLDKVRKLRETNADK
jgi:hypothetical protein